MTELQLKIITKAVEIRMETVKNRHYSFKLSKTNDDEKNFIKIRSHLRCIKRFNL